MACKIIYKGVSYDESDFKSQIEKYIAINNLFNENESLANAAYEALGFRQTVVTEIGTAFKKPSTFSQEDYDALKDMGYTEDEILDKLGAKKSETVLAKTIVTPQQKQQAQQLYSQYLDTIFPDSKVKDIVYHGTNAFIESFDKNKIASNTLNYGFYGKGFYFNETKNDLINWWKTLYKKEPNIVTAIINTKNPYKEASNVIEEKTKLGNKQETEQFTNNLLQENYDAVLPQIPKEEGSNEYVVFEPEQIHILGSKQDIEGFKEFATQPSTSVEVKPGVEDLFEMQKYEDAQDLTKFIASKKNKQEDKEETNEESCGTAPF